MPEKKKKEKIEDIEIEKKELIACPRCGYQEAKKDSDALKCLSCGWRFKEK